MSALRVFRRILSCWNRIRNQILYKWFFILPTLFFHVLRFLSFILYFLSCHLFIFLQLSAFILIPWFINFIHFFIHFMPLCISNWNFEINKLFYHSFVNSNGHYGWQPTANGFVVKYSSLIIFTLQIHIFKYLLCTFLGFFVIFIVVIILFELPAASLVSHWKRYTIHLKIWDFKHFYWTKVVFLLSVLFSSLLWRVFFLFIRLFQSFRSSNRSSSPTFVFIFNLNWLTTDSKLTIACTLSLSHWNYEYTSKYFHSLFVLCLFHNIVFHLVVARNCLYYNDVINDHFATV